MARGESKYPHGVGDWGEATVSSSTVSTSPASTIDLVRASSVDDTFWLIVTNASKVHLYSGVQDIDRGMAEGV